LDERSLGLFNDDDPNVKVIHHRMKMVKKQSIGRRKGREGNRSELLLGYHYI
jgi:hypothetical protein